MAVSVSVVASRPPCCVRAPVPQLSRAPPSRSRQPAVLATVVRHRTDRLRVKTVPPERRRRRDLDTVRLRSMVWRSRSNSVPPPLGDVLNRRVKEKKKKNRFVIHGNRWSSIKRNSSKKKNNVGRSLACARGPIHPGRPCGVFVGGSGVVCDLDWYLVPVWRV